MDKVKIPGIGTMTRDPRFGWLCSKTVAVPVLRGKKCRLILGGYEDDPLKEDYHAAVANFLSITPSVLTTVETDVFRYYQDCRRHCPDEIVNIQSPKNLWRYVRFGKEASVTRRNAGDRTVYISLECGCDWDPEHGLQIVFKEGMKINKIGPFDGHLSNADAFADEKLENVVYAG